MRRFAGLCFVVATAITAFSAACDLELTPYQDPVDGGQRAIDLDSSKASDGNTANSETGAPILDAAAGDGPVIPGADAGRRRIVFVTSDVSNGALGGQLGADQKCKTAADKAKLEGVFLAWVSQQNAPAVQRMGDVGPWYLPDRQTLVFASRAAMTANPAVAINRTEENKTLDNDNDAVWTGTTSAGVPANNNQLCNNWATAVIGNGLVGSAGEKDAKWTQDDTRACGQNAHLYCFEQ